METEHHRWRHLIRLRTIFALTALLFGTLGLVLVNGQREYDRRSRYNNEARTGASGPGDTHVPPVEDRSYFEVSRTSSSSQHSDTGEGGQQYQLPVTPKVHFDWQGRRREYRYGVTTPSPTPVSRVDETFRRTFLNRTTERRTETSHRSGQTPISRTSYTERRRYETEYRTSSSTSRPITFYQPPYGATGGTSGTGGTGYTFITNRTVSQYESRPFGRYPWGNITRPAYDPDLDGTTLPPIEPVGPEDPREFIEIYRPPESDRHPLSGYTTCDESSCYPATGNLLIGRENQLKVTSTCGVQRPERYCVISNVKQKKKCFICDSSPNAKNTPLYHGIENIVSRPGQRKVDHWWQAENGVEHVSIQLDLEAEFHFTHLIITFKTFRPAAMVIERSHDDGKSWSVYQYYASDCRDSFGGVPIGPRTKITDVVCESKYTDVEPSEKGEVIFRVLPPHLVGPDSDPYSPQVQSLLKVTNLRVNFTKLHTLGDDLLDPRQEIKEKYYYAIYDMVVRGSCSCYGHASRCIAEPGQQARSDMVYGRCECTHHTKGFNCEQCEDFYNDLPWRPAIGRETNACKKCNCNDHSNKCHFDGAVYEQSGRISGGVCDDCQHNTMGKNCDQCKPFFFHDPRRPINDAYACQPCDCDPVGSLDDGVCDSETDPSSGLEAGRCHCKVNVDGRRCDECKAGFWNMRDDNPNGCEPCTCDLLGTVGNRGCNQVTGECLCKRNVVGRDCNQCAPEHYGLSEHEDGCLPCDCDPGGSYDNQCDIMTGQCKCRMNMEGRRCDRPRPIHFSPALDFIRYEAEFARPLTDDCIDVHRPRYPDRPPTWTGPGFMKVFEGSGIEFDVDTVPRTMHYDIIVRYEPQRPGRFDAKLVVERRQPNDPSGPCDQESPLDDTKRFPLSDRGRYEKVQATCLEAGKQYKLRLEIEKFDKEDATDANTLIDSIVLVPRMDDIPFFTGPPANQYRRQEFDRFRCDLYYHSPYGARSEPPEPCQKHLNSIGVYVHEGAILCECDPTGSESAECNVLGGQCKCKKNVIGRKCDRCDSGHFGFGPNGCIPCECHPIGALDNNCDQVTGQCRCRENTFGRQCDECQRGFWDYPHCKRCNCNGHTDDCDSKTGVCINCRDYTAGHHCEVCERGYYGQPLMNALEPQIPCRPCPCPGIPGSNMSHAATCELDLKTRNVLCHCEPGYAGERCDRCANNFYGEPAIPGGECRRCECNNNIDEVDAGNCDARTGECLKCLYNTEGPHCEYCRAGFYGVAEQQQCRECVCNILGTDPKGGPCNRVTGQCACLPNVEGLECDRCAPNHWKIASGQGCEPCDCDPLGSYSLKCNEFDGQCHCRPGHGGRQCNQCMPNFWGDPRVQCYPCECNPTGSATMQCNRENGTCVCLPGIGGDRCDRCARGYTGNAPHCNACGECFDNWDAIIGNLKDNTHRLIDAARRIKQTGTTGAYRREFAEIETKLQEVQAIIEGQNITEADIAHLDGMLRELQTNLTATENGLNEIEGRVDEIRDNITAGVIEMSNLRERARELEQAANDLKENATSIQEANVEGAYNLTLDAQRRSRDSENRVRATTALLYQSEKQRRNTERLITTSAITYNSSYDGSTGMITDLQNKISLLESEIPDINELVCASRSTVNQCESTCGGAGCGKCGGVGCEEAATTKAEDASSVAKQAEELRQQKQSKADEQLSRIRDAREKADEALRGVRAAWEKAQLAHNTTRDATSELQELLDAIERFLSEDAAKPAEIRVAAQECLELQVSSTPEQILDVARQINQTVDSLTNIRSILQATSQDLLTTETLKKKADQAKADTDEILETARRVRDALQKAREAQERARESINKATGDIQGAQGDLSEIDAETNIVKEISDKATEGIESLQGRLDDLKKKSYENQLDVGKATRVSEEAEDAARQASAAAKELERQFESARDRLNDKTRESGQNKERVERLREAARQLAENADRKRHELTEINDQLHDNQRKLANYQELIDQLNAQMAEHLHHIDEKAKFYSSCQA